MKTLWKQDRDQGKNGNKLENGNKLKMKLKVSKCRARLILRYLLSLF